MKKFERAEIICNDDDTYTVEFYPVNKPTKGNEVVPYNNRKTMTADSLESAIEKIKGMAGSNGKKAAKNMNRYFDGEMGESEEES